VIYQKQRHFITKLKAYHT